MTSHLATDRLVWTYLLEGQPAGVITGYLADGGLVVEQIMHWRGHLTEMLRVGLEEAWSQNVEHLILMIPDQDARRTKLATLARRMGFEQYAYEAGAAWWVRYRPWTQ